MVSRQEDAKIDYERLDESNGQILLDKIDRENIKAGTASCDTHLLEKDGNDKQKNGLTVITGAFFITGEIVGGGLVALPASMVHSGWGGVPAFILIAVTCTYCCVLLGRCWSTVKRIEGEKFESRVPYPIIGEKAFGKFGKYAVDFALYLNTFIVCVVYMLLAAKSLSWVLSLNSFFLPPDEEFRIWLLICFFVLIPMSWFGTPKDFWVIAVFATITVGIVSILVVVFLGIKSSQSISTVEQPHKTFISVSSALGTFVFAFTGATLAPTIQTDMKDTNKFPYAICLGYGLAFLFYAPPTIGTLIVLGKHAKEDIVESITAHKDDKTLLVIGYVAQLSMAIHFLFAFVIFLNPISQQLEKVANVPNKFSWQRCLLRGLTVVIVFAVAQLLPSFSPLLDLAGGSVNVFLCFIFPCLFYLRLHWDDVSKWYVVFIACIVIIATVILLFTTYSNVVRVVSLFKHTY